MTIKKTLDRRTFLKGTAAAAAAVPFERPARTRPAFAQDAANPFGVAEGSTVDAVIFNGGYGIDYVEFAAEHHEDEPPEPQRSTSRRRPRSRPNCSRGSSAATRRT